MTYMPLRRVTIDLGNLRGQIFSRTEFAPSAACVCTVQICAKRAGRPAPGHPPCMALASGPARLAARLRAQGAQPQGHTEQSGVWGSLFHAIQ